MPGGNGWHWWEGEVDREMGKRVNMVEIMYTRVCKSKMTPVETVPEIRGGGMKENCGGGEFKYDIFDTV
jgi:hypothetical protein